MKKKLIIISIPFIISACSKEKKAKESLSNPSFIVLDNPIDPICKMDVLIGRTDTILYQGKIYGFCSPLCKEHFIENTNKKNTTQNE